MYYVARLSSGTASAVATDRAIQRYGRERVLIHFANVLWEDEDNYRFVADCMARWGGRLYGSNLGKTPLDVFEAKGIIPNSAMAPCSFALKIKPFEDWLWRLPKPMTILSGLSWAEPHRIERLFHYHQHKKKWRIPQGFARRIHGVYEDFPLLWQPIEFRPYSEVVRSWGIEPPAMYKAGFSHANCGGRCVKQGMEEWHRLLLWRPDRFAEMAAWEQEQRAKQQAKDPTADHSICRTRIGGVSKPITLVELARQWEAEGAGSMLLLEYVDDTSECACTG